ncbi:MAG: xylulokinase [Gammaproteobacteria bacterium]|jgi:xylulokinase
MRAVLGIDLGTQSLKVVVYDFEAKRIAATASAPLALDQDRSGKAEQNPVAWLEALTEALRRVPTKIRDAVLAIGVAGQQHGLVALGLDGSPLRAAKLWCDTTTQSEADEIMEAVGGRERCITLSGNAMVTGFTAPKILWLKKNEPRNYDTMADVLLPHDFLNFALTGQKVMEHGDASGTGLLDVRTRNWRRELLDAMDASRDIGDCLPPLVDAGDFIGATTPEAAARFGLRPDLPVAVGGGDNMMGAIGTGNVRPGQLTMSLGTSGTLYAFSDEPIVDPKGNIAAFCSSTGGWLPLLCTMNCTFATELMRAPLDVAVAEFDATIAAVPPGADGLLALPFFNGERTPNLPNAKGSLLGLDATNCSKGHLLRATVEGATFGLKFGIDELAALGLAGSEIVLTGGGANSRIWQQIVADITGLPVVRLRDNEGAGFGAALQALWTLERQSDRSVDIAAITDEHVERDPNEGAQPNAEAVGDYVESYADYRRALAQIAPLYSN